MNFLLPIIAAVLQASSFTIDKVILSFRKVDFKVYLGISFVLIFLINGIIFLLFQPPFSLALFANYNWLLILISIGLIILTNFIFYWVLNHEHLGEMQTLSLLAGIPVILISSFFFTSERQPTIVIPALIALLAVVWSHWEHHHFQIARRSALFLLWSFSVAPVGVILSKTLLATWNPISLELVRSGVIACLLTAFLYRGYRGAEGSAGGLLLITNILTSVASLLIYFGYQRLGIVYTTLLFSIQPLLVYFASVWFLREHWQWKKGIAFFIVVGSITFAQLLGR